MKNVEQFKTLLKPCRHKVVPIMCDSLFHTWAKNKIIIRPPFKQHKKKKKHPLKSVQKKTKFFYPLLTQPLKLELFQIQFSV